MTPLRRRQDMVIQHSQTRVKYTRSIEAAEPLSDPLAFVDPRFTAQSNASAGSPGYMYSRDP